MKNLKWDCGNTECDFFFVGNEAVDEIPGDEEAGILPTPGLAAGVIWEGEPDWMCPECGGSKELFTHAENTRPITDPEEE